MFRHPWIRWGLGLGLFLVAGEAAKNVPAFLTMHYRQPIGVTAMSVIFDLALGLAAVSVSALVLRIFGVDGRSAWPAVWAPLIPAALILSIPPEFPGFVFLERVWVGSLVLGFPLLVRWARIPWFRRSAVLLGVVATLISYGLPYVKPTVSWQLEHQRSRAPEGAANVLLVVLDTVRADRLDLYGYERPTFPELSRFAEQGAVFERAISAAPWTLPSHASMFTGLYPSSHGAGHERPKLDAEQETLAEILRKLGWHTVALSANPWLNRSTGMTQGFAHQPPTWLVFPARSASFAYRIAWNLGWITRDHGGAAVREAWSQWLDSWDGQRPFFAFLNFVEPHIPLYDLPERYLHLFTPEGMSYRELKSAADAVFDAERHGRLAASEQVDRSNELYDGGVRYNGDLTMGILKSLEDRGVLDRTVVVLVADHGDLLGEHDMYNHTRSLTDYLLRVPLVVRYPPRVPAGQRIATPVTTAALLPTLLDLLDVPVPKELPTRSFAPLLEGKPLEDMGSPILSEVSKDLGLMAAPEFQPRNDFDRLGIRYRSLEENGFKLVVDSEGNEWLFRPVEDPTESQNLAARFPDKVTELKATLGTLEQAYGLGAIDRETMDPLDPSELDPEVRERLRSLGYLN